MGKITTQVKEVKAGGETNLIEWFSLMRNSHWKRTQHIYHHAVDLIQVSPRIDPHSGVTPYQAPSLTVSLKVIP